MDTIRVLIVDDHMVVRNGLANMLDSLVKTRFEEVPAL